MSWLGVWEIALEEARADGVPGELWKFDQRSASFVLVARTRHPAFMGTAPVKHDPERDNA
jgi:hypothetical protein